MHSLSIEFKSKEDLQKARILFDDYEHSIQALARQESSSFRMRPVTSRGLQYKPHSGLLLGFNAPIIPWTIWAVSAWVAVNLGRRDEEGFYLYLNNERYPITFDEFAPGFLVDKEGVAVIRKEETVKSMIRRDGVTSIRKHVIELVHNFPCSLIENSV